MTDAHIDISALTVRGLSVDYGGLRAVDHLDLEVHPGQVVGLIGPNGAGKTTTLDALTGFATPTHGTVMIGVRDITRAAPHVRARAGLGRTFQAMQLFRGLTVRENVLVAAEAAARSRGGSRHESGTLADRALAAVDLLAEGDRSPGQLPLGRQRMVAVARALATDPSVLLLDEPAAGLDSSESLALGVRLAALAQNGLAVLLVEHDMGLVLSICDQIRVMDFGSLIAAGTPAQIRQNDVVLRAYLGNKATRLGTVPSDQEGVS